jgi:hypothetical protein
VREVSSPGSLRPTRPGGCKPNCCAWAAYPLLVIDEVGYIHPFEVEAANLFIQLVSARHERASLIVTSNKLFGWGEVSGAKVTAATMIDRLLGAHRDAARSCRVLCLGAGCVGQSAGIGKA